MSSAKRPPQQRLSPIEMPYLLQLLKIIINKQVKQNWLSGDNLDVLLS